jgi:hypothetical protein
LIDLLIDYLIDFAADQTQVSPGTNVAGFSLVILQDGGPQSQATNHRLP